VFTKNLVGETGEGYDGMIDTIVGLTHVDEIPRDIFQGWTVTTFRNDGDGDDLETERLWLNPGAGDPYLPRITFWPDDNCEHSGWLKAEFSVHKMAQDLPGQEEPTGPGPLDNLERHHIELALDRVDAYLERLGIEPGIRLWNCQRVDYAVNWQLGKLLPVYMSVLNKLRVSNYSRHPFDAAEGVVWKSKGLRGRWVKFYNKSREVDDAARLAGERQERTLPDGVLRFEVSNYKDAVAYLGPRWFGGKTVGDVVQMPRAAYVLSRFWSTLGLDNVEAYGGNEYLLFRMRDELGTASIASAYYVLELYQRYGSQAWKDEALQLCTKSTWYYQLRKLKAHGFLTVVNDDDDDDNLVVNRQQLPALHLPLEEAFKQLSEILPVEPPSPGAIGAGKFSEKFSWEEFATMLGLTDDAPQNDYILRRWYVYLLDR
jgi:hypothetical protein